MEEFLAFAHKRKRRKISCLSAHTSIKREKRKRAKGKRGHQRTTTGCLFSHVQKSPDNELMARDITLASNDSTNSNKQASKRKKKAFYLLALSPLFNGIPHISTIYLTSFTRTYTSIR